MLGLGFGVSGLEEVKGLGLRILNLNIPWFLNVGNPTAATEGVRVSHVHVLLGESPCTKCERLGILQ